MPYYSWPDLELGGLDLLNDPETVGWSGAIDLLNVDFDRFGRVRSRDGYTKLTTVAAPGQYVQLFSGDGTVNGILAARSGAVDLINTGTGAVSASSTFNGFSVAVVATPGSTATYIAAGSAQATGKLVGATFSQPANMPLASTMAVTPWDNRLVVNCAATGPLGPSAATSNESQVWFSNAGAPETWGANNYVMLNPGDGDFITAIVAWRELLFVFKRKRFYVFTGTSTDSAGNPIFNYRTIDVGEGADTGGIANTGGHTITGVKWGTAVAAPDGVYFANTKGIWKTTGGPPALISTPINPLFGRGAVPPFYVGPTFVSAAGSNAPVPILGWYLNRLYATIGKSGGGSCMAVWDTLTSTWTVFDINANAVLGVPNIGSVAGGLYFSYGTGTNDIGQIATSATTDAGTAITSRYQSGFNKFSYKSHFRYIGYGEEKTIRQTQLKGYGSPTLTWYRDFQTTAMPGTGNAVTLGTAPNIARGLDRNAARGESLSFKLSATSPWQVDTFEAFIRGERPQGEET